VVVVADTSVWIDHLLGNPTPAHIACTFSVGIEVTVPHVYDGDMAKVETTEAQIPAKRVWPPRTMDDLSPEDRARQMRFAEKLKALRGKIHLDIDLDELRGRRR
jgi:hypothetical protein